MEIYKSYVLKMLGDNTLPENTIKTNLMRKFNLSETECDDILGSLLEDNYIQTEFDKDYQNIFKVTSKGDEEINKIEDDELKIDYKTLLGDMYKENSSDDEIVVSDNDDTIFDEENSSNLQEEYELTDKNLGDFSNYQINVKKHTKNTKFETKSSDYIKCYKLEFAISLVSLLELIVLMGISFGLLYLNNCLDFNIKSYFFAFGVLCLAYPFISLIIFSLKADYKAKNNFNFAQTFKIDLLCVTVVLILILSLNFLFGFNLQNWLRFLPFWLFPSIAGIICILYPINKLLLINSKNFNA